jgi:uncharacterized protein
MLSRKMFYSVLLIVAVLAFAAGCSAGAIPAAQAGSPLASPPAGGGPATAPVASGTIGRGITVVGVGKASGAPNVANISVGVETQADTVQQAVADNKAKMTLLLDALKALDVAAKDIQTSNYGVYTERQPVPSSEGKGALGPTTYHVNNQVNVTVRDVNKLGDVLDKAVTAGANNIYGISFSVDDTTKLQADARAKAVADAKARAESLATLAGVTLGDVVSVSEVIGSSGPMYDTPRAAMGLGGGGGAPVQPGELEVNMSIQVTFAIK